MSNTFKEGDRVVYTGGWRMFMASLKGKRGTVQAIINSATVQVLFDGTDSEFDTYNVFVDNLAPEGPRFFPGQLVRCLEDNDPGYEFTTCNVYEVESFVDGTWPRVNVVEDDNGDPNGWGAQFFEPFVEPEPTAPAPAARDAIVCVLDDDDKPLPATRPYLHANRVSAITESERLAEKNPGKHFAVYEAVSLAYAPPPPKPVAMSIAL